MERTPMNDMVGGMPHKKILFSTLHLCMYAMFFSYGMRG